MIEKIPFFISPPYHVPPMTVMRSVILKATNTSERSPYLAKSAHVVLQALRMVQSGLKFLQFLGSRMDEHVLEKMRHPGHFGHQTHTDPGIFIGPAKSIHHIKFFTV